MGASLQDNTTPALLDIRKQAFDYSPDSVLIIDPRLMKFIDANQTALKSLGYSKDELVGLKIDNIDATFTNDIIANVFESIINSKEQHATIPTRYRRKDNSIFDVEVYLRCFKDGGNIYLLASSSHTSVLQQVQNELNFHSALFNKISDAIISTDEHFVITSWNNYAEEMFGWTADEAIGSPTRDLTSAIYPNQTSEEVTQFVRDNGYWKGEIFAHQKNGNLIPVMLSVGVIKDAHENVSGYVSVARDISERHKLENELRLLNERLEQKVIEKTDELSSVLDRISDVFVAYDTKWNYTYVNKKALEITGKKPEELLGKKVWEVFPQLVGTEVYENYHLAMSSQQSIGMTFLNPFLDRWFEGFLYPSQHGLTSYFRDVTEKKIAEQKLKESEEQYRTIVDTAHEGILQIDEDNKVVFANNQLCAFLGYTTNELLGKNALLFLEEANQQKALARVENRKKGVSEQYEMSLFSKTGQLVHTLINSRPLFKNNKYAGSISTIMDITERKYVEEKTLANEKRLNALFENSSDGICLFSPEGAVIEINPAVEKILGYKREELIATKPQIVVPEDVPLVLTTLQQVLNDKDVIKTIEYQISKPDGSKKWLRATYRNMVSNPDIAAIVINFVDIDDSKRIQEALKESETKYRKAQALGKLGHWQMDFKTEKITWSEEIYKIFGMDPDDELLNYETFMNYVHPEDKEYVHENRRLVLAGLKPLNFYHRIVTSDKTVKCVHEVADVERNEDGQPTFLSGMLQDVSAQKAIEEQLSDSQQQLSIILNNIVDSVALFKVEGINRFRYLAVNDAYTKTTKVERDRAIGKLFGEIVPSPSFDTLFKVLNNATKTCEIQKFESVYKWFEGEKAFQITAVPIKNTSGIADKILVVSKDITQQKLNEQKLIKSEENNRVLFERTPVPIWILDKDLNFIKVNETAIAEYGYTRSDFLSMNLKQIKLPEDHAFLDDAIRNPAGSPEYSGITRHILKNGEIIYARIQSTTLKFDRQDVILVASKNITSEVIAQKELIENEQQLSLIFDSTKDGMWLLNVEDPENYRVETYNKAYEIITGVEKEKAVGMLIQDVLPPESFDKVKAKYKQVIETGEALSYFISIPFPKGEVTAEVTLTPIKDHKGKVVRVLGTGVDVSQQQRARKELVKMNLELRQLTSHLQNVREEERTNIAREIHDELGQQLTGLKMDLSWLKKKTVGNEDAVSLKLDSALQLVDVTINTVRKIASELRPSIIDDLGIKEALDWHCQEFTNRTGINVVFQSDIKDLELPKAVPTALFRIVQEALTNVARHSKATEVKCILEEHNNDLLLCISDNGQGFSLENREQKTLGLLGMRERVAILKGEFNIKSEPGRGTEITVNIPLTLK